MAVTLEDALLDMDAAAPAAARAALVCSGYGMVYPRRANGVLTNFLVESSLLLRICIFCMGAPLSRVFAYQTNESTPLLRVPLLNTQ